MVQGATSLYNAVYVGTATTGQGDITLGAAEGNNFLTYDEAGVADETIVTYLLEDGDDIELGRGLYDADYDIQQRDTVLVSKISGTAGTTKLTLSGSATVRIVAAAEDFMPHFGDTVPTVPTTFWVRTTDFALFIYYWDGNSGQYIQLNGTSGSGIRRDSGEFFWWPAAAPPDYALECDGSAISRTVYADLFAVIGTTFGVGDGSTTFNLPDVSSENRFIRGADGTTISVGDEQLDAFQGHHHSATAPHRIQIVGAGGDTNLNSGTLSQRTEATWNDGTTAGGSGTPRTASETRPINLALLGCIVY